jgi:hypothetical protein
MPEIWGNLPKSQTDDETIEEAIARIVDEHNDDEESHLGTGQSLQSHKASEIIDHLASSIVTDKILERNITIDLLADFGEIWRLSLPLESLDAWSKGTSGSASIFCNVGQLVLAASYNESPHYYCYGHATSRLVSGAKTFRMRAILGTTGTYDNFTSYLCVGTYDIGESENQDVGWKIVAGKLYALHRTANGASSTEYTTEVLDLEANAEYNLEVIYTPETDIKYYVNDVLVDVHDTNLPSTSYNFSDPFNVRLEATSAGYAMINLYSLYFQQNL